MKPWSAFGTAVALILTAGKVRRGMISKPSPGPGASAAWCSVHRTLATSCAHLHIAEKVEAMWDVDADRALLNAMTPGGGFDDETLAELRDLWRDELEWDLAVRGLQR